jgi:hypothetical protein
VEVVVDDLLLSLMLGKTTIVVFKPTNVVLCPPHINPHVENFVLASPSLMLAMRAHCLFLDLPPPRGQGPSSLTVFEDQSPRWIEGDSLGLSQDEG